MPIMSFGLGPKVLNSDQINSAAHLLAHGRLSSNVINPAEGLRPGNESEAYALQQEVSRQLSSSRLGLPVGPKIGCTTPVMQAFLGIHSPCAGDIFAATVMRSNGQLSRAGYRRLGVECEIVVELSRDIAPDAAPFTRETIAPRSAR